MPERAEWRDTAGRSLFQGTFRQAGQKHNVSDNLSQDGRGEFICWCSYFSSPIIKALVSLTSPHFWVCCPKEADTRLSWVNKWWGCWSLRKSGYSKPGHQGCWNVMWRSEVYWGVRPRQPGSCRWGGGSCGCSSGGSSWGQLEQGDKVLRILKSPSNSSLYCFCSSFSLLPLDRRLYSLVFFIISFVFPLCLSLCALFRIFSSNLCCCSHSLSLVCLNSC